MTGGTGTLTLTGPSFTNTGTLALRLGGLTPGSQFDRLVISGTATLGGTLNVNLLNGFAPAVGDMFDVLTYGSRVGEFATIEGNGQTYAPTYGPSKLTLAKQ
jgi:hypothetical protein